MEQVSIDDLIVPVEQIEKVDKKYILNINIGILGHVDSGKTSLARALTKIESTASLDKNPQSKEKGITLDLGFSAFYTKFPSHVNNTGEYQYVQYTLVDCPGHASLIRTILGGASIIDVMILVIDITKGIQTQTAECLVIGELLVGRMYVVLNKIDLLPENEREQIIEKKMEALRRVFAKTKFGQNIQMIAISAMVGADEKSIKTIQIQNIVKVLQNDFSIPTRKSVGQLLYLVDHCFLIKGKGTVVTGTVLQGNVRIADEIEFPEIKEIKKVKSMQMFKKPVEYAQQGDRVALLFTQLDPEKIERTIASTPKFIKEISHAIINIEKVKYYKYGIKSKQKFHMTTGHQTVMGIIYLFSSSSNSSNNENMIQQDSLKNQNFQQEQKEKFDYEQEYIYEEELISGKQQNEKVKQYYGLIEFEKPILSNIGSLLIGSKLDTDLDANICRIAFHGKLLVNHDKINNNNNLLKIFRFKQKNGIIDRVSDPKTLIVKDLFKKQANLNHYLGKFVTVELNGKIGKIQATFGTSGKVKVYFADGVADNDNTDLLVGTQVTMQYKKYYFQS